MSAPTGNTRNTPPGPSLNAPQFNGVNPQVHPQPAVAQIEADPLTMGEPVNMHVGLPSLHLASPSLANESELSLSQQFDVAIGRAKAAVSGDPGQFIRLFVEVAAIHEAMDKTSRRSGGHEVAAKTAAGEALHELLQTWLGKNAKAVDPNDKERLRKTCDDLEVHPDTLCTIFDLPEAPAEGVLTIHARTAQDKRTAISRQILNFALKATSPRCKDVLRDRTPGERFHVERRVIPHRLSQVSECTFHLESAKHANRRHG